jgi:uncharacterized protein (TIGR03067 family)
MRKSAAVVLALCALAAVAGRADEAKPAGGAKEELKKLRGAWTVTKTVWRKRESKVSGVTYAFDGGALTRSSVPPGGGKEKRVYMATFSVKVDASKRPRRMVLSSGPEAKGPSEQFKAVCIYKIEGGVLYLAMGRDEAPKDFSGDEAQLFVMKREKAEEKAKAKE